MLYFLAWALALPFLFLYLLWRARRQPDYLRHWPERLGWGPIRSGKRRILIHAVSVGETRAAAPLLKALQARHPDLDILLTHTTPTGRATGRELFGESVAQSYLPYDFAPLVGLFLGRARPDCCVFMETEIWPGFFMACKRMGIPIFLINARLSERSARGYRRVRPLVAPALAALSGIAAQTSQDGARLESLGAQGVQVTGNLKFDVTPPADSETRAEDLRRCFQGKFVFLAASTRDGEEAILLDVLDRLNCPDILLVLVPRHPQRFEAVGRMIAEKGWAWGRRGNPKGAATDMRVFLGDSMGELAAYYAAADLAYVGGSLLPFGGQNLIEAAAAGCPALVGPHTWNFADATERAIAEGAACRIGNIEELRDKLIALRSDRQRRQGMAQAGLRFAAANRGATQRILALIESAAPLSGGRG
jgi:3-deoxy-D-manno-octulosonic-acid transferase